MKSSVIVVSLIVASILACGNPSTPRIVSVEEVQEDAQPIEAEPTQSPPPGSSRFTPAPFGATVATDKWQVTVLEVIRGDEAWQMVQATNQFNEAPGEGMEYVAVKVRVEYITTDQAAETTRVSDAWLKATGEANVLYDNPSVVDPEPALDADLFPGGQAEGWATLQAAQGEGGLVAVFKPLFAFTDKNTMFLSLE
jgi:hypothetical protein